MGKFNLRFPENTEGRATLGAIARSSTKNVERQRLVLHGLLNAVWRGDMDQSLRLLEHGDVSALVLAQVARASFGFPPIDSDGNIIAFPSAGTDAAELRKVLATLAIDDYSEDFVRSWLRPLSVSLDAFEKGRGNVERALAEMTKPLRKAPSEVQRQDAIWRDIDQAIDALGPEARPEQIMHELKGYAGIDGSCVIESVQEGVLWRTDLNTIRKLTVRVLRERLRRRADKARKHAKATLTR